MKTQQVDIKKSIKLRQAGLSYQEIAETQGVSRQAIHQALQDIMPAPDILEQFKAHKADILAAHEYKQFEIYSSLDDDEKKEMLKRRGFVDFGITYDKERLERGQPTNISGIIQADLESIRQAKGSSQEDSTIDIDT